ncbi:hypothetical protein JCM33374_g305 [Metschnikowia sp. JCM 33374]|nr:hypothetical protein JCM33374_g305 [Metschnikowia sp. JCM 33374]
MPTENFVYTVGVLALQGAFAEHLEYLAQASQLPHLKSHPFQFLPIRTPSQLSQCHALVVPGGESTSMSLIAERTGMLEPLVEFCRTKPVWGTCAGLIFLASEIRNGRPHQKALGAMGIQVTRNAFGRQLDSFGEPRDFSTFAPGISDFRTVFIRAPVVSGVKNGITGGAPDAAPAGDAAKMHPVGPVLEPRAPVRDTTTIQAPCLNEERVEILHALENGLVVAVRQGNKLGTSFHPELSGDCRFHGWFLQEFVVGQA